MIDLSRGLGNFTLPITRHAKHVVGIEGDLGLIERARYNAQKTALPMLIFIKQIYLKKWQVLSGLEVRLTTRR